MVCGICESGEGATPNWNGKIERKGRDPKKYPKKLGQKGYRSFEVKRN
jgi:hypothetical protein